VAGDGQPIEQIRRVANESPLPRGLESCPREAAFVKAHFALVAKANVAFRSAKRRLFAERKATFLTALDCFPRAPQGDLPGRRPLVQPDAVLEGGNNRPSFTGFAAKPPVRRQHPLVTRFGRRVEHGPRVFVVVSRVIDERMIDQNESPLRAHAAACSASVSGKSFSRCDQNHSIVVFSPASSGVREKPGSSRASLATDKHLDFAPT